MSKDQSVSVPIEKKKRSTRDIIFHTIKSSPQITVDSLAEAADVSPVTVRHHLNGLQAQGLIEATSVRRKVGRPYYVYSISERGQELFPTRYLRLTSRLLDEMKHRLPEDVVDEIFRGVVEGVLEEHRSEFEHLPLEDRLDYLVDLLAEEGFLSTWEHDANGGYRLIEYSCPYLSVGARHSEVCGFDKQLMIGVLQVPMQQHSCMLEGASCCQFSINTEAVAFESPAAYLEKVS
jgi:predicted ArsR family transcriptional regulator